MKPRYMLLTFAYAALLLYLMSAPDPLGKEIEQPGADIPGHLLAFGGMAAVLAFSLYRSNAQINPHVLFGISAVSAFIYGVALEFMQLYLPYRSFEYKDIVVDGLGALLGCYLFMRHAYRGQRAGEPGPP